MNHFFVSTDKTKLDVKIIHQFLSTEAYWSKNIPYSTVEESISNSLCFGIYNNQTQAGFARVISDYATFAYLCDVFILPEYRGNNLSKMLMQEVMNHAQLQGLRRWMLGTADAHGLYSQFGWTPVGVPERWMEVHNKNVYAKETAG
jgi:GNAT superfamily N-acetyltransferase